MAVAGRKPLEDRTQVRHRNGITEGAEWREVVDLPYADGPPLGDRPESSGTAGERPLGIDADSWPKATLEWWDAVRTMPHCRLWNRADWMIARAAAEAHARFVEGWKGCASGAELRQREKQLGMTHDFRRDLRIRYVDPPNLDGPLPANVTRVDFGEL
jgi:hypothetical protein